MKKRAWILSKAVAAARAAKPELSAIALIAVWALSGHPHPAHGVLESVDSVVWEDLHAMIAFLQNTRTAVRFSHTVLRAKAVSLRSVVCVTMSNMVR